MSDYSALQPCPEPLALGDLVLGILLIGGILLSYLPQLVLLGIRKSHVGLSLIRLVLATMCSSSNLIFYVILEYYDAFYCCTSTFQCFSNTLSFTQSAIIVLCDEATILLAFYYFDEEWLKDNGFDMPKLARTANIYMGALAAVQALIFIFFISFALGPGFDSSSAYTFGQVLIAFSSIGTIIVFLPQIYETYQLRHTASLSLPTVFMQGFGAVILCYFSAVQNPWYIFVPTVLSAFFNIVLFCEGVYFTYLDKKAGPGNDPTEAANHSHHHKEQKVYEPLPNVINGDEN